MEGEKISMRCFLVSFESDVWISFVTCSGKGK